VDVHHRGGTCGTAPPVCYWATSLLVCDVFTFSCWVLACAVYILKFLCRVLAVMAGGLSSPQVCLLLPYNLALLRSLACIYLSTCYLAHAVIAFSYIAHFSSLRSLSTPHPATPVPCLVNDMLAVTELRTWRHGDAGSVAGALRDKENRRRGAFWRPGNARRVPCCVAAAAHARARSYVEHQRIWCGMADIRVALPSSSCCTGAKRGAADICWAHRGRLLFHDGFSPAWPLLARPFSVPLPLQLRTWNHVFPCPVLFSSFTSCLLTILLLLLTTLLCITA